MLNPPKTTYVWNLDGTLFKEFPSQKEAGIALSSSHSNFSRVIKLKRIVQGKYLLTTENVFPGIPDRVHGKSTPVWAWDKDLNPIGEFASQRRAADSLGVLCQSVHDGVVKGYLVYGKYIFTNTETPPARIQKSTKTVDKAPKYKLEERKWVSLGGFKSMEEASKGSGLSARGIRLMIKGGNVYRKVFRARMKGKLIVIEKMEWIPAGDFKTMAEIANKVNVTIGAAIKTAKNGGVISGRYKVSKIMQPIETPSV